MKVTAYIRKKSAAKNNVTEQASIFFRVRDREFDCKAASELTINPNHWSQLHQGYKPRVALVSDERRRTLNRQVKELTEIISDKYYRGADGEWLKRVINEYHHPNMYKLGEEATDTTLVARIRLYIKRHELSKTTHYTYNGIIKKIERFQQYQNIVNKKRNYKICVDEMTTDDLHEFKDFMQSEYLYVKSYPKLYEGLKSWYVPKSMLSENGCIDVFKRIITVFKWCEQNGVPTKKPFLKFEMQPLIYGTPYYLTLEERNRIFDLNLSAENNQLRYHRDIFMFQCLVGCRQGDIPRMSKDNIVNGALEYIPHKTIKKRTKVVRVPLNSKALEVLARYSDRTTTLFPYFEDWLYNNSIRKLCKMAGLDRMVSVIDQKSREEVKKPLYDIASSHMGRRTFIGNMYKKVKDPNLIASMSGHAENSTAFNRYRSIDDEMKRELVDMIG